MVESFAVRGLQILDLWDAVEEVARKRGEVLRQDMPDFRPEQVDLSQRQLLFFENDLAELEEVFAAISALERTPL